MRLMAATVGIASALSMVTFASAVHAQDKPRQTACTKLDLCYCVKPELLPAIANNIASVRKLIATEKAKGKAIGYLSVPLSPAGGGSFAINSDAAGKIAERVVARFGDSAVWILNPAALGGDHMTGANGADYMYMWTQILEGSTAHGEDFDFFYFVGPTDFARYFFPPKNDGQPWRIPDNYLGLLEGAFDDKIATIADFKKEVDQGQVSKSGFRNYYGLRASVSFSYGSHDEWNIARILNERRRGTDSFGIANQIAMFFDGQPVSPGNYETPAAYGDAGRCVK